MATDSSSCSYALLVLPTAPSSFDSLKTAYLSALTAVLSDLAQSVQGTDKIATLEIAAITPGLLSPHTQPRTRLFDALQKFLAGIYKLIGIVGAKEAIELDTPGGVDARVFFLDYNNSQPPLTEAVENNAPLQGPIIDLQSLAACSRKWSTVYIVQNQDSETLLTEFTSSLKARTGSEHIPAVRRLAGGTASEESNVHAGNPTDQMSPHYFVAVGGTFDHLHAGHKLLLTATALAADPYQHQSSSGQGIMTIGITGDELLVNKKYAEYLESWEARWQRVSNFLESIIDFSPPRDKATAGIERVSKPGPNGQYVRIRVTPSLDLKFVQISDPFGPTITDESISALIVSKETRSGGKAVNDEREKKGWRKLDVFEVDVLDFGGVEGETNASAEAFASKISSTDIRRRQMNMAKGNL
ncbi:hypothetical protein FQN54_001879 [Arachnomyces sp. PD_36]|nr:hypothetical protein FQN54_001879 [Arachnomyces sp. PD_36]